MIDVNLKELYLQNIKQTEIYTKWVDEQRQQTDANGFTDNDFLEALSHSTGELAQELMKEALNTACSGKPSNYAAVLANSVNRQAMILNLEDKIILSDLKATMPGDFYYAICVKAYTSPVDMCEYKPTTLGSGVLILGYIIPKQVNWKLEIREIQTGEQVIDKTFRGSSPGCPANASFTTPGETIYEIGTEPSSQDVLDWISTILKKSKE